MFARLARLRPPDWRVVVVWLSILLVAATCTGFGIYGWHRIITGGS